MTTEMEELVLNIQERLSNYIPQDTMGLKNAVINTNLLEIERLIILAETEGIKNSIKILN